jgi:hypothetical protein
MHALVDWYKDIPYTKDFFPLAHLGVVIQHWGLFFVSNLIKPIL